MSRHTTRSQLELHRHWVLREISSVGRQPMALTRKPLAMRRPIVHEKLGGRWKLQSQRGAPGFQTTERASHLRSVAAELSGGLRSPSPWLGELSMSGSAKSEALAALRNLLHPGKAKQSIFLCSAARRFDTAPPTSTVAAEDSQWLGLPLCSSAHTWAAQRMRHG